jgi:hypothetical protein
VSRARGWWNEERGGHHFIETMREVVKGRSRKGGRGRQRLKRELKADCFTRNDDRRGLGVRKASFH